MSVLSDMRGTNLMCWAFNMWLVWINRCSEHTTPSTAEHSTWVMKNTSVVKFYIDCLSLRHLSFVETPFCWVGGMFCFLGWALGVWICCEVSSCVRRQLWVLFCDWTRDEDAPWSVPRFADVKVKERVIHGVDKWCDGDRVVLDAEVMAMGSLAPNHWSRPVSSWSPTLTVIWGAICLVSQFLWGS